MAKVKIQGHASGTGVLTVTAPNTSTDRTITLPDATGELLSTAGGTMTGALSLQNNVSNSTSATLKLTGSSNATQDNFILFGDNATSVPIAMGFDNSENTFKIARNANDDLNSNIYFKMDSSGAVTMPSQPAFLLQQTSNVSNVTGNGTNHTMVYGTETFDQNADCSSSTFTAPVTGKYHFNVSIAFVSLSSATDVFIDLMTSNRNYRWNPLGNNPTTTGNTPYPIISGSILADMDASDTAYVRVHVNGVGADSVDIYGDAMSATNFSGHLVC